MRFLFDLARDVRYAIRQLVQQPLLAIVLTVTLALGIGANTAIYSVLRSVLLAPLPYEHEDRLVMVWSEDTTRGSTTWIAVPEYLDYRRDLDLLDDVAAFYYLPANLVGDGEPRRLAGALVSDSLFDVLGVTAAVGRTFRPEEMTPEAARVVVIGDGLFRRRYGGDPAVVGRQISINGWPHTVVGVMPAGFRLPLDYRGEATTELWAPLRFDPAELPPRNDRSYHAVARLGDGASLAAARQQIHALNESWHEEGLLPLSLEGPGLVPIRELLFGDVRPMLWVLLGAAGFVLLIGCANVASLLLARGEGRRQEIGVRVALGAGRGRLIRQLLTESVVLAASGGAFGLLLGVGGVRFARAWAPAHVPRIQEVGVDAGLLLFTLAATLTTGLLCGLLPAAHCARGGPRAALTAGERGSRRDRMRTGARRLLVVGELALAVALAVGATLMIRSFSGLRAVDAGFDAEGVLTLRIELPSASYSEEASRMRFWDRLVAEVAQLPGVSAAGTARRIPLGSRMGDWSITIEGRDRLPGENPHGDFQVVVPGYFEAMGIELVRGRFLAATDHADSVPVVVVNRTMADAWWPGEDVLGKRFRIGDEDTPWYTIVGIVGDVKHNTVTEEPREEMYHAVEQWGLAAGVPYGMTLAVRGERDPLGLVAPVTEVVRGLDPNLPVAEVRTLEEIVAAATADSRFATSLLTGLGLVALLLAATGIYGVVTYSVRQRTQEIGIRMAVGADRRQVVRALLAEGLTLLGAGLLIGGIGAGSATGLLAGMLYGVEPLDRLAFVIVASTVSLVALMATWIPARRAAAVDPAAALRGS